MSMLKGNDAAQEIDDGGRGLRGENLKPAHVPSKPPGWEEAGGDDGRGRLGKEPREGCAGDKSVSRLGR